MRFQLLMALSTTAALVAVGAAPAQAQSVTASLPSYSGSYHPSGFPVNLGTVGTFTYALPTGSTVLSAFLEGTYGTSGGAGYAFSTASFDASIDGTSSFTVCGLNASTCYYDGAALRPFSIALPTSSYSSLLDGSAALSLSQTSGNFVQLGSPTLRIQYAAGAVPESATWAMMLVGFGTAGYSLRRRPKRIALTRSA